MVKLARGRSSGAAASRAYRSGLPSLGRITWSVPSRNPSTDPRTRLANLGIRNGVAAVSETTRRGVSRRAFIKMAGAAAGVAALVRFPQTAEAHDLRPTDPAYRFDKYEDIVNRSVRIRQLYQWPNINNPIIYANISNGLNGFQFSYGIAPEDMQVVVQAYFSANGAMYDDHIWEKYRLGEAFNIKDPVTDKPATRNIWYKSKIPAQEVSTPPKDRSHAYYSDTSIEGLQRRGVLFLI